MATLISIATGNFTAASTWDVADATSELDSEAQSETSTTVFRASANFTPGAITVDAVALKFQSRSASPTGTFTVELFNSTGALSIATVVVNITDLPLNGGWVVFPIGSTLLLAATNYQVRIKTSTISQVTIYRDGTAANWSRQLRTTTTQAPATGDKLIIAGEHTGAGTGNSFTITMDNTTTTSFGAVAFAQSLSVSKRSTLAYGTSASTNYYLKVKGISKIYSDGTFTVGTSGTPMPSTSTAVFEFDPTASVDSGLIIGDLATFNTFGNALSFDRTFLAADASAAATSLTTTDSTGWLNNDNIVLASTTRTPSQSEAKLLTANASGTTLTITGITNAHSGTAPIAGELANLTRNVVFRGTSTSLNGYVNIIATSTVNCQWTEFYQLGSATGSKRGIDIQTTTGSCTFNRCSVHDNIVTSAQGFNVGGNNHITLSNNVMYNINTNHINFPTATANTALSFTGNICILNTALNEIIQLVDVGGTITNNTVVSSARDGMSLSDGGSGIFGTISGNTAHANTGSGISTNSGANGSAVLGGTVSSSTCYRNGTGFNVNGVLQNVIFDGIVAFGNSTQNININGQTGGVADVILNNLTLNAGATLTCPIGITIGINIRNTFIDNSSLGATTGHSTGDLRISQPAATAYTLTELFFRNTLLSSSTEVSNLAILAPGSVLGFAKHDQVTGNHKTIRKYGVMSIDTTIFNFASPSARQTPNNASFKFFGTVKKIAVPTGQTATVSVKVRKSVVGDGSAYNGAQPRLILKADPSIGISADTVLATATNAANGAFENLTATTPTVTDNGVIQIYVDCDGTAGFINVDDWVVNN